MEQKVMRKKKVVDPALPFISIGFFVFIMIVGLGAGAAAILTLIVTAGLYALGMHTEKEVEETLTRNHQSSYSSDGSSSDDTYKRRSDSSSYSSSRDDTSSYDHSSSFSSSSSDIHDTVSNPMHSNLTGNIYNDI